MYIFQPDRILIEKQLAKVANVVRGRTLDVGAGTSDRYSSHFTTDEYIRMDTFPGEGIDVVGSAYEIPFEDNSFDSVVCTQVLEHLAYPAKALSEMHRVLKPGGSAIITVPQTNELHEEPHDYLRYTEYGLKTLSEDTGFTVVSCTARGGYYALIAQLNIRHWIDRYHLYKRPILGKVAGKLIKYYGEHMLRKDSRNQKVADAKHTIGWCIVVTK